MKMCPRCATLKNDSSFGILRKSSDGLRSYCKMCDAEACRQSVAKRNLKLGIQPKDKRKPENVNFDEPPAKLLKRVYYKETNRNYKKVTNGKQLFKNLNPEIAAEKCPNLKKLLNEMLTMAESAIQ